MKSIMLFIPHFLFSIVLMSKDLSTDQPVSDVTRYGGNVNDEQFNRLSKHEQKA
jgi:hypothetical protein